MRMRGTLYLVSFVLGVAVVGCATPQPLVSLHPDLSDVIWVSGRASIQKDADGVRVAAAFERQEGDRLALRVEVENATAGRVEVTPQRITFAPCQTLQVSSCQSSRQVIDPEQMLSAIDTQASRGAAEATNEQIVLGTVAVAGAVADVAAISSGQANRRTGLLTASSVDAMGASAAAADTEQARLAEQRAVWSDQALRRNTLFPGQAVGGLVYIPISDRARFLWLQAIVAGRTFSFHFAQTVTEVALSTSPKQAPSRNR